MVVERAGAENEGANEAGVDGDVMREANWRFAFERIDPVACREEVGITGAAPPKP